MGDNDGSRSVRQPITFIEDMSLHGLGTPPQSRAELEQEMARRTAKRFSTKALRAALFPQHEGIMERPDSHAHAHAAGEMLATMITGMSLEEAQQVTADDLLTALDGLPPNHTHCAALAVKTLGEAIASYEMDGKERGQKKP